MHPKPALHRLHHTHLLILLPASVVGGAETLTRTLATGLRETRVTLLTQAAVAEAVSPEAVPTLLLDDYGLSKPYDYSISNVRRYARALSSAVAQERPDAVLAMMHAASIFLAVSASMHPRRFRKVRRIGSIHGQVSSYFEMLGRQPSAAEQLYAALMFSRLHAMIVPSQGVRDDLTRIFPSARRRVTVIPNGIDIAGVRERARATRPGESKRRPWITMAARMNHQKDHETLLRAFREIAQRAEADLVLIGDGEERPRIERLAKELGIADRVLSIGFVDNPYPWLLASDIVVLSSHFEGFGLVLIEAMALGRPVVATDCPSGPAEVIRDGLDGFLVPMRDHRRLAGRLMELLADETLRARMGASGNQRAECFSLTAMLRNYERLVAGGTFNRAVDANERAQRPAGVRGSADDAVD